MKLNPWSDDPRYYPPGSHPATARLRAELKKARDLRAHLKDEGMDTEAADEYIAYCETKLSDFEAAESDAKARDAAASREERSDADS